MTRQFFSACITYKEQSGMLQRKMCLSLSFQRTGLSSLLRTNMPKVMRFL